MIVFIFGNNGSLYVLVKGTRMYGHLVGNISFIFSGKMSSGQMSRTRLSNALNSKPYEILRIEKIKILCANPQQIMNNSASTLLISRYGFFSLHPDSSKIKYIYASETCKFVIYLHIVFVLKRIMSAIFMWKRVFYK